MHRFSLAVVALTLSGSAFAQMDAVQIGYVSNLNQGDAYVNLTNGGAYGAFLGLNNSNGDICANIYVFDPAQEMLACCSCVVTPDALNSLSVQSSLLMNTLTPSKPSSIVIKLVANAPVFDTCDAASITPASLAPGLRAFGTTLHQNTSTGAYQVTENAFQDVSSGAAELSSLATYCGFIFGGGSGFGICKGCPAGGQAGAKK
jgi:hypothetical protein